MKKIIITMAAVFLLFSLIPISQAACTNACSSSQYTCSLTTTEITKGTSGTLTVSVTNQQSQAQSSVTAELQGSWFTGDTTSQVISSINSGEAKSLDYSITPNTAGSYDVCVNMGGTCTAECTQVTVNSEADISVVSLVPSVTSFTASQAFTVSATIQNSGTATAGSTTGITATLSDTNSKCTITDAAQTVGTLGGSSSSSVSWSVVAPTTGTCAFSLDVSGSPGGTDASTTSASLATTTTAASSSGDSPSSSGGGSAGGSVASTPDGTKVSTTTGKSEITIPSISDGDNIGVDIDDPIETGVRRITFVSTSSKANISITVSKLDTTDKPVPEQDVVQYIEISTENITDSDISSGTITFQVKKTWLSDNGFAEDEITLLRYTNGWDPLATKKDGEDATNVYYLADTPGFSVFAIVASKIPPSSGKSNVIDDVVEQTKVVVQDYGIYIVLIAIFIIIILGWVHYHDGHKQVKDSIFGTKKGYKFKPKKR
jgi:PGF-pre-PGF domain-containing protein